MRFSFGRLENLELGPKAVRTYKVDHAFFSDFKV
jgi:hypothetical protein